MRVWFPKSIRVRICQVELVWAEGSQLQSVQKVEVVSSLIVMITPQKPNDEPNAEEGTVVLPLFLL
jgi:hypothetical protein